MTGATPGLYSMRYILTPGFFMPRRSFDTGVYHIYNRGFEKMTLFKNKSDFQRFYEILIKNLSDPVFVELKMVSYSFLPNHFHCIIFNPGVELSLFMWRLQNAYAKYFNMKYERKGQVFEWRFKAKYIHDDIYLHQCIAYVNFNALKHGIVTNIVEYPWTSYHQIVQGRGSNYLNNSLQRQVLIQYADMDIWELEH